MNKAKMTFRFDTAEPVRRSVDEEKPPFHSDAVIALPVDGGDDSEVEHDIIRVTPRQESPVQLPYEDWSDPFQNHAGLGIAVMPAGMSVKEPLPSGDWELGTYPELESKVDEGFRYKPPTRGSGWKLAGSIMGAVITGCLFGYVVLSLFNQDVGLPLPGFMSAQTADKEAAVPVLGGISEEASVTVQLPQQTYYFLQYGVFSNPQGVEQAQKELQAAGIAAAPDRTDSRRVYAGISTDREQAKLLSGQLKADGVNLILHEVTLPEQARVSFQGDEAQLEQFMKNSSELIDQLSAISSSLLMRNSPEAPSPELLQKIAASHERFTEEAAEIRGKFGASAAVLAEALEQEMNSSMEALEQFKRNGSKAHLWEIQESVMRFVLAEQQLFLEI
ncbi:sporulation protein [Paenibacillus sp. CAA11]|uniref:SPOR domain-containing protein n=1 Tax=Paenibacillus sp. CAA11 TaxID=1532905 RepID=UPI000D3AF03F|nr:SPOR domain-containing protein [Paenibacillus sp. CAA11]AWB45728.1 sporulation protein [Paenibacillus sp. CAA11]